MQPKENDLFKLRKTYTVYIYFNCSLGKSNYLNI